MHTLTSAPVVELSQVGMARRGWPAMCWPAGFCTTRPSLDWDPSSIPVMRAPLELPRCRRVGARGPGRDADGAAAGMPATLARTLRSTNTIESMISICREHAGNVKRWQDGTMALRWCAVGMLEAAKQFRRVNATCTCRPFGRRWRPRSPRPSPSRARIRRS
jgi:hypothetical protein